MSRIPRSQEYLKAGFTAEAVSAARYRAFAAQAAQDGLPQLGQHWLRLAAEKDRLAIALLQAAEQVRGKETDVAAALSEDRYENDILYPKMIRDTEEPAAAEALRRVVAAQQDHLRQLETLRNALQGAQGDVQAPV